MAPTLLRMNRLMSQMMNGYRVPLTALTSTAKYRRRRIDEVTRTVMV